MRSPLDADEANCLALLVDELLWGVSGMTSPFDMSFLYDDQVPLPNLSAHVPSASTETYCIGDRGFEESSTLTAPGPKVVRSS